MQIWKYQLSPECRHSIPAGARILHFGVQNGEPHIWCLVDPDEAPELRHFRCVGTGFDFDITDHHYIGTFHSSNALVFHFFEHTP